MESVPINRLELVENVFHIREILWRKRVRFYLNRVCIAHAILICININGSRVVSSHRMALYGDSLLQSISQSGSVNKVHDSKSLTALCLM